MHVLVLTWMLNTQMAKSICTTQHSDPLMSVALSHGLARTSVRHGHHGGTTAMFPAPPLQRSLHHHRLFSCMP